jgi:hypothetical protein
MLEANSNPLVTNYPIDGYPETWNSLMELVLKIQTDPEQLGDMTVGMTGPKGRTQGSGPGGSRYVFKGWELLFNEKEEQAVGAKYNACRELNPNFQEEEEEEEEGQESNEEGSQEVKDQGLDSNLGVMSVSEKGKQQKKAIATTAAQQSSTTRIHGEGEPLDITLLKNPEEVAKLDAAANEVLEKLMSERENMPFRLNLKEVSEKFRCKPTSDDVLECTLAHNTLDETPFWIIASGPELLSSATGSNGVDDSEEGDVSLGGDDDIMYPVVWVAGGAHGNEVAGVAAAEHIKNNWKPQKVCAN